MTIQRFPIVPAIAALLLIAVPALSGSCADTFRDVPANHWAADAVNTLADAGVLKGYPDGTYRGDNPVTRYELAVALQAMIEFMRQSREPIDPETLSAAPSGHWAERSMKYLQTGMYLPRESFIFRQPGSTVSTQQLGEALASVAARLIAVEIPPSARAAL